ncbi:MAG: RdgB/HAM1 family non-canonical purine NTP pyrophosphatase [Actinobacteria bacterium]|nr:RdgB/HAM1 family non-canonical purine NTP pyrophosphatase [Actinomycetota bacterium]
MEIVIASKNKGKIREIKSYFSKLPKVRWLTFEEFESFPEVCEDGKSFIENAELKAKAIAEYTGKLTLADDSGLEVEYLGGKPGVMSSRYAEEDLDLCKNRASNKVNNEMPGIESSEVRTGYGADNKSEEIDRRNRQKLLNQLKDVKDPKKRKARFVCSMVLWDPKSGPIFETIGVCGGFISEREAGSGGFGYDPVFIPEGYTKTMAELDLEEKNKISHRGKALKALREFVEKF